MLFTECQNSVGWKEWISGPLYFPIVNFRHNCSLKLLVKVYGPKTCKQMKTTKFAIAISGLKNLLILKMLISFGQTMVRYEKMQFSKIESKVTVFDQIGWNLDQSLDDLEEIQGGFSRPLMHILLIL